MPYLLTQIWGHPSGWLWSDVFWRKQEFIFSPEVPCWHPCCAQLLALQGCAWILLEFFSGGHWEMVREWGTWISLEIKLCLLSFPFLLVWSHQLLDLKWWNILGQYLRTLKWIFYIFLFSATFKRYKIMNIILTAEFLYLLFALVFILSSWIIGGQYVNQTSHKPEFYVTWSLLG